MKKNFAFTLIELLIVVAIIAILAAIAVPNFLEAQTRSKVSRTVADMRSMATAIESYHIDNNKYPPIGAPNRNLAPGNGVNGPSVYDPSVMGISSRFIWVTTPIAYVTSVFRDPFIPHAIGQALAPTGNSRLGGYDTYDYAPARSFTPEGFLGQAFGGDRGGGAATSGAQWRMVGAGPDTRNAFGGGIVPDSGQTTNERGVDYDPTNGTISTGDVVRIGGGPAPATNNKLPAINRVSKEYNF